MFAHCARSALGCAATISIAPAGLAQHQDWILQPGRSGADQCWALAPDASGGVFLGGEFDDQSGYTTIVLARYDASGEVTWQREFGTDDHDALFQLADDGAGGVFAAGYTDGDLGGENLGGGDVWLAHYDGDGNQSWIIQFGSQQDDDPPAALVADGEGGVFLARNVNDGQFNSDDAWLAHYDEDGNRSWARQLGTGDDDSVAALASDGAGGVFLAGRTFGDLDGENAGSSDVWIARYTANGQRLWIRQYGSADGESATALEPDGENGVFIAGSTDGDFGGDNAGSRDVWMGRCDENGTLSGLSQFGSNGMDAGGEISRDGFGGYYISGVTDGDLGGPNQGGDDLWLANFDLNGQQNWIVQFGSSGDDRMTGGVVSGEAGVAYVGGFTGGDLGGPNAGDTDIWLARFADSLAAPLGSFNVKRGEHLTGGLAKLEQSDNARMKIASEFTGDDPAHLMIVEYKLTSEIAEPVSLDVHVEAKLTENGGIAKIYLKNWTTGGWDRIARYGLGRTEEIEEVTGLDALDYVNAEGKIRIRVRHEMAVSTFESHLDWVRVLVR